MKSNIKIVLIAFIAVFISSCGIYQENNKKNKTKTIIESDDQKAIEALNCDFNKKIKSLEDDLIWIKSALLKIQDSDSSALIIEKLNFELTAKESKIKKLEDSKNDLVKLKKDSDQKYNEVKKKYDEINDKFKVEVTRLSETAYGEMDLVYMKYLSGYVGTNEKQTLEKLIKQKEALNAGEKCLNEKLNTKNIDDALSKLASAFNGDTKDEYTKMKELLEGYCTANNNFINETKDLDKISDYGIKTKGAQGKIGKFVHYPYLCKLLLDYVAGYADKPLPILNRCE